MQKIKCVCIRIGKNVEGNCDYYGRICMEKNLMRVVGQSLGQELGVTAIS